MGKLDLSSWEFGIFYKLLVLVIVKIIALVYYILSLPKQNLLYIVKILVSFYHRCDKIYMELATKEERLLSFTLTV